MKHTRISKSLHVFTRLSEKVARILVNSNYDLKHVRLK